MNALPRRSAALGIGDAILGRHGLSITTDLHEGRVVQVYGSIELEANKHPLRSRISPVELFHPHLTVVEGLLTRQVEHEQTSVRATVVASGKSSFSFGACSIPNTKLANSMEVRMN